MAGNRTSRHGNPSAPDVSSSLRARDRRHRAPLRPQGDRSSYVRTRHAEQFRALENRSVRRRDARRRRREAVKAEERRSRQRFLLSIVFGVLIFFVGILPLLTTFRQYVASQSHVSDLIAQEQSLHRQKANLDEQINRWKDNAYVIAQARTRLGFVYPGETSVRVICAEKYAQSSEQKEAETSAGQVSQKNMPWNELMRRSLLQSDEGVAPRSQSVGQTKKEKKQVAQRDPAKRYTPVNQTQKNPYVLTQDEREQAKRSQTNGGTGEDLGGIPGLQ